MKEIKLTHGYVSLVDDEDFEYLNQWKWFVRRRSHTNYAERTSRLLNGKQTTLSLHRVLLNVYSNMTVDHIDHNGLNNQKSNLRICTQQQNCLNKLPNKDKTSKGVHVEMRKHRRGIDKYITARIKVNGKGMYLGVYKTERDAAQAYNEAALKYYGEFASLNILE